MLKFQKKETNFGNKTPTYGWPLGDILMRIHNAVIWSYFNKFKNLIKSNSGIIDELNSPKTTIRLHILQSNVSLPEYQVCNLNSTLMFCLQHLPIDCPCVSQYFKKTSLIIDLITSLYAKLGLDFFSNFIQNAKEISIKSIR